MIRTALVAALVAALVTGPLAGETVNPTVVLKTELGEILLEILVEEAPVTAANFLRYVDEERLEGATFYRTVRMDNQPHNTVKIEVIQGGLGFDQHPNQLRPIAHETTETTGILHEDGTISMARNQPGSASSEFFICIASSRSSTSEVGGTRTVRGSPLSAACSRAWMWCAPSSAGRARISSSIQRSESSKASGQTSRSPS